MMQEHERIQELLAGYALRSLDEPDRREADRHLAEHLPACRECRQLLADFEAITGDLALAPAPVAPPDLLLLRLRRAIGPTTRRRASVLAAAAAITIVLGMGALSVRSMLDASRIADQRGLLGRAVQAMSLFPATSAVPLQHDAPGDMVGITGPDLEHIYLVGQGVPDPAEGNVYRLWLGRDGAYSLAAQFVPDDGHVGLEIVVDPTGVDEVAITEEPAIVQPTQPMEAWRWWSTVPHGA